MDNKILQGYLNDFQNDFGFSSEIEEPLLFEHFANYCILSKIHPEAFYNDNFKIEEINIGGGNDTGIDGVAIVVNDHIVSSIEEIESLMEDSQKLDVKFIFVQSKTSSKFNSGDIGTFIFGVKDFFKEAATLKTSPDLDQLRSMKKFIYSKSILMDDPPLCELHYVTAGKWTNDQNVIGRANSDLEDLSGKGLFKTVNFIPVDANSLETIYKEVKNKVTKEINFEKHTPLPRIEGIKEAYIGIINVEEFINLIKDSDDKIQKTLFYDNVRDFQGLNPVNKEIEKTLQDPQKQLKFPIFNNGITIVAKNLNKVGTYFKVKDFQVVNGCQTSHILFNNRHSIDKINTFVPIKLICSTNQDVINDIIKATNRQTEVKVEAFESLKDFHKKLQNYYDSFPKEIRIYYERRPREYDSLFPPVPRARIITLAAQINAVISMFWNEPHSTHRYYGELLKAYSDKIFKDDHYPEIYYTSGLALHKVDHLLKSNLVHFKYKKFKYHLLTCIRILESGFVYPQFNSKKIGPYCEAICIVLNDQSKLEKLVVDATRCIDRGIERYERKHGRKNINEYKRIRNMTYEIIEEAKRARK